MPGAPVKDILFIRKHPRLDEKAPLFKRELQSLLSSKGATTRYAGHDITFFFPGYGQRQRELHSDILEKMRSGKITDVVDIGAGGALNPTLKRGDLILSTQDIPLDTLQPIEVRRRKEISDLIQALAQKAQTRFFESRILTSAKLIGSKQERIKLFDRTRCSIVQMEHCWFLRALQNSLGSRLFKRLYITHIEIVADVVTQSDAFLKKLLELLHGIDYCILRNQGKIGKVKRDFLKLWLQS